VNLYICRDFFFHETAYMNSMHGFWIAMAKRAGDAWFHPSWWPYWDAGMPFEFTYAPLIPGLTALWSWWGGISHALALQRITGIVYCLAPLTLFLMAWLLTRTPGYSFAAALLYSLFSTTQLIVPDPSFSYRNAADARRLYLIAVWDDTPHLTALALLPLVILFLFLSIRKRRLIYYGVTVVLIALTTSASMFGPVMIAMAALCLLFALPRADFKGNLLLPILIGCYALARCLPFLPPSLMLAIPRASQYIEGGWTFGSVAGVGLVVMGWIALWRLLPRLTADWRLQFFALFAYLTSSVPLVAAYLHWQFLPQPVRYKLEMELALALIVVFGSRAWFERAPLPLRMALVFLLVALAGEQLVRHRRIAKALLRPAGVAQTIEYRVSSWVEQNLPNVRVMLPGSIGEWANTFAATQQFSGSSWSTAYSRVQQWAFYAVIFGGDARVSLAWLRAFGAGAIAVSGPKSPEFWKPFAHPLQFEGVLPALWREEDVTIYGIPQKSTSLAHVIPEAAILREAPAGPSDVKGIERYVAALDDPSMPSADFRWEGHNRIRIRTTASAAQAISVQVSYHPGWHAKIAGQPREMNRDGLGLMWLRPGCDGPCEVDLDYDGGWELRICRYISFAAIGGLLLLPLAARRRRAG